MVRDAGPWLRGSELPGMARQLRLGESGKDVVQAQWAVDQDGSVGDQQDRNPAREFIFRSGFFQEWEMVMSQGAWGRTSPVSRRDLRLDRTAGQPLEMPLNVSRLARCSCVTVSRTMS